MSTAAAAHDPVNRPSHYMGAGGLEAIHVIEAWGLGFHLGNAMKYLLRAGRKGEAIEDLRKARWYVERFADNVIEGFRPLAIIGAIRVDEITNAFQLSYLVEMAVMKLLEAQGDVKVERMQCTLADVLHWLEQAIAGLEADQAEKH